MRLALVCGVIFDWPANGIANLNTQVIRQLACASPSPDIEVWSLHDSPRASADLRDEPRVADASIRFRGFSGSKRSMLAAACLNRRRYDTVVCMHVGVSPIARLLRRRNSYVHQFLHGLECWRQLPFHHRWGMGAADALIANSESTHSRFVEAHSEYADLPWDRCWLGLSQDFSLERGTASTADDAESVLIVGRMCTTEMKKGQRELISLWPEVLERFPAARLDIVGDGDDQPRLEALAHRLGLLDTNAVKFWGHLEGDALHERFRECRVFAMPSDQEGFGMVYVEAMASKKPVIASPGDAGGEVVEHERTGLVVEQSDSSALRDAICRLLGDAELRTKMGDQGLQRVLEHFTERAFGKRFRSLITTPRSAGVRHTRRDLATSIGPAAGPRVSHQQNSDTQGP